MARVRVGARAGRRGSAGGAAGRGPVGRFRHGTPAGRVRWQVGRFRHSRLVEVPSAVARFLEPRESAPQPSPSVAKREPPEDAGGESALGFRDCG